jgi:DNA-directed RNA polymerase subunit RPC12/RpoP
MDKSYIYNIVQKITKKEFHNPVESSIVQYEERINIRCPYCKEGKTKTKKRGNIYLNKLFYICFRCDKKTSFDKFCRDFNEQIDPDKKLEMITHLDSVIRYSDYEDNLLDTTIDDLIKLSDIENAISKKITPFSDFKPIVKGGGIYKYLVGRGIDENMHKNIYQAKYWYNDNIFDWVIVMLNRRGDRILGMQIRNLKSGKNRMFKIYNYENLLEWVNWGIEDSHADHVGTLDMSKIVMYNKLSYYFNILNIDFSSTITIFEGYLDSLFFPNSIGLVGVNTDSKFLEENNLDIKYLFDNDDVGNKKSEEKIKEGFSVFLWKKLFEDVVQRKKTDEPHKLYHRISKIKDVNKLAELVKNPYEKLELYKYFSRDILDIGWIPSKKKSMDRYRKNDNNYKKSHLKNGF